MATISNQPFLKRVAETHNISLLPMPKLIAALELGSPKQAVRINLSSTDAEHYGLFLKVGEKKGDTIYGFEGLEMDDLPF